MENFPLMQSEIVWVEEECHEDILPLKEENCKLEETPASIGYGQSSEQGIEENINSSEGMQFTFVKCEEDWASEVHETEVLDVKEEIISEEENILTSPIKEAGRLPPSGSKTQSEEIVPQVSCTRIGENYYCIPYDTQLPKRSDFNSHITNHKQISNFQCPRCEKSYQFRSKLLEHIVIHSYVKPFHCKICDKRFVRNSDLKKHMFVHTNDRAFRCNICDKRFKRNSDVKRHMDIHYIPLCNGMEVILT